MGVRPNLEGCIRRTEFTDGALYDKLIYHITDEEFAARDEGLRLSE